MKVSCVISVESPSGGDSNVHTQHIHFQYKTPPEIISKTKVSAAMGFLLRTSKRVRNSHDKRAIGDRATEVLLLYTL